MKRLSLIVFLMLMCSGCVFGGAQKRLPTVLAQKEMMWTIPAGTEFKAIQKPAYPKLTEFVVADDDLKVVYAGNLLELEQEANRRVIKSARSARTMGAVLGILGSVLAIIAGLVGKKAFSKKDKKKKKKK
jgi:hypothetical protein